MNCAVGSIPNTSPLQRNSLSDAGRSARVANGWAAAAFLAGALLLGAGANPAQAQTAGGTAAAHPAQAPAAKKPAAKAGSTATPAGEKGVVVGALSLLSLACFAF